MIFKKEIQVINHLKCDIHTLNRSHFVICNYVRNKEECTIS